MITWNLSELAEHCRRIELAIIIVALVSVVAVFGSSSVDVGRLKEEMARANAVAGTFGDSVLVEALNSKLGEMDIDEGLSADNRTAPQYYAIRVQQSPGQEMHRCEGSLTYFPTLAVQFIDPNLYRLIGGEEARRFGYYWEYRLTNIRNLGDFGRLYDAFHSGVRYSVLKGSIESAKLAIASPPFGRSGLQEATLTPITKERAREAIKALPAPPLQYRDPDRFRLDNARVFRPNVRWDDLARLTGVTKSDVESGKFLLLAGRVPVTQIDKRVVGGPQTCGVYAVLKPSWQDLGISSAKLCADPASPSDQGTTLCGGRSFAQDFPHVSNFLRLYPDVSFGLVGKITELEDRAGSAPVDVLGLKLPAQLLSVGLMAALAGLMYAYLSALITLRRACAATRYLETSWPSLSGAGGSLGFGWLSTTVLPLVAVAGVAYTAYVRYWPDLSSHRDAVWVVALVGSLLIAALTFVALVVKERVLLARALE